MRTEREKMLAGELYDPFDAELVGGREQARSLCQVLNKTQESINCMPAVETHVARRAGSNLSPASPIG